MELEPLLLPPGAVVLHGDASSVPLPFPPALFSPLPCPCLYNRMLHAILFPSSFFFPDSPWPHDVVFCSFTTVYPLGFLNKGKHKETEMVSYTDKPS